MIKISKNLKIFVILFTVYTLVFRYILYLSIIHHNHTLTWSTSIIYGIVIYLTAFLLGKADNLKSGRLSLGFKYHLAVYIIYNTIAILWYLSGYLRYESLKIIFIIILFWGLGLLLHVFQNLKNHKETIRGVPKDEIFN